MTSRALSRRLRLAWRVLVVDDPNIRVGRQLSGWGERMGLTLQQVRPFVHAWKNLRHPLLALRHKLLARRVGSQALTAAHLRTLDDGYAAFAIDEITGGPAVAELLTRLWRERCMGEAPDEETRWRRSGSDYPALRDVLRPDDLVRFPEIADFVLNDFYLALATRYFGAVPRLASVMLWWTTANDATKNSQLFHTDMEDGRQLKLFVNLTDVAAEQGPFVFLPAAVSRRVRRALGHECGRLTDDMVYRHCARSEALTHVGSAGGGMAVDTSRCLHFGSRTRDSERLILMAQYVPFNVQRESTTPPPKIDAERYADDPVRHLIATVANRQV